MTQLTEGLSTSEFVPDPVLSPLPPFENISLDEALTKGFDPFDPDHLLDDDEDEIEERIQAQARVVADFFGEIEIKEEVEDTKKGVLKFLAKSQVSISYRELSNIITTEAPRLRSSALENSDSTSGLRIADALYKSFRISQWRYDTQRQAYVIPTSDNVWYVSVQNEHTNADGVLTPPNVSLCRGLKTYPLLKDHAALHLFQLLQNVSESIKTALEQERSKDHDWDEGDDEEESLEAFLRSESEIPEIHSVKDLKEALESYPLDKLSQYEIPILRTILASRDLPEWKSPPYDSSFVIWMDGGWVIQIFENCVMFFPSKLAVSQNKLASGKNASVLYQYFSDSLRREGSTEDMDVLSEVASDIALEEEQEELEEVTPQVVDTAVTGYFTEYNEPMAMRPWESAASVEPERIEEEVKPLNIECGTCFEETGSSSCVRPAHMEPKAQEESPKLLPNKTGLNNLKSVEGRVLTLMEVAFPDAVQRDAMKSLIKKEFRREMNKINRTEDEE